MSEKIITVGGGGGFIGGHLVAKLRQENGVRIRAIDIKPTDQWYQVFDDVENVVADLQDLL